MKTKITSLILCTLLAIYAIGYIIGMVAAISNKDMGLTAMFFSGIALVVGLNIGHSLGARSEQRMCQIRNRNGVM